jgi:hypothetical protein
VVLHLVHLEAQGGDRCAPAGEAQMVPESACVQVFDTQGDPELDGEENRRPGQSRRLGWLPFA